MGFPTSMAIGLVGTSFAADVPEPAVQALDHVLLLETGSTMCAGAHVGEGMVATAYHCVAPGGRVRVTDRDGGMAIGRVRGVDRGRDLAVVYVEELTGDGLVVGEPPAVGAGIAVLGHPLAADLPAGFYEDTLRFSLAEGVVGAVGSQALQISAPLNPGNSGGPLVDAEGRLVGVVSRRLGGQGLGFAARVDDLDALKEARMSPVGGTVALELGLIAMQDGTIAVGPRLELAARDRVVLEGSAHLPLSARWTAVRFGEVAFLRAETHAGLRQRIGRGAWTVRVDGWGGVGWLERLTAPEDEPLGYAVRHTPVPVVGGAIRLRNIGFELGYGLGADGRSAGRAGLIVRSPGVFTVW